MKILVAGGAGYIGSALVPVLQNHGYDVDVIDLLWFGNHLPTGTRIISKNLFSCKENDLEGYDQVIFLAGLSNDPMAEYSPEMNFVYNAALPSYLAYVSKQAGVKRFIYASSCSVYGYTVDQLYNEDMPTTCNYPYGISKLQGERGVLQMQSKHFSTISLRKGTVSGHSPRMRFDLMVNTMFKCAMQSGTITINNPAIWRPILDIQDACTAYLRAVQSDESISGVFNITSGNFTVGHVGDTVKDDLESITGRDIRIVMKNDQDFRNYKVDGSRALTTLGFCPKHQITDIVNDLYRHKMEYLDFSKEYYYNIRVFKNSIAGQGLVL